MLQSILMVWVLSQDIALSAAAYERDMGYLPGGRGVFSESMATALDRPEIAGQQYLTLYPPSGPQVGLRLVEAPLTDYYPMRRLGWSAIEMLVRDPDSLRKDLQMPDFEYLAGPAFLSSQRNVYAMQALGPSRELLYLTHILDPEKTLLKAPPTTTAVGHTFIMVMGSNNLSHSLQFFKTHFDNAVTEPIKFRIDVLSDAYGLPRETQHALAMVSMAQPFGIEIDQYPEGAAAIPDQEQVRGGVFLVTVSVDSARLKKPLPFVSRDLDNAGAVTGGIILMPSGTPLEVIYDQ